MNPFIGLALCMYALLVTVLNAFENLARLGTLVQYGTLCGPMCLRGGNLPIPRDVRPYG
jgi:hypothetical protein